MGVKGYGEAGQRALRVARSAERRHRDTEPSLLHDKVFAAVRKAGFAYDLAVAAAWEALAE
jgi:hypothetical protein